MLTICEKLKFISLYRASKELVIPSVILTGFIIILAAWAMSGCAYVSTTDTLADGRKTTTTAFETGRTEAIKGFSDKTTRDGREIGVESAQADVNVQALRQSNELLGSILGAALKAYTGKP